MRAVHFTQKESHRSYGALVWGTWVALFGQRSRSRVLEKYDDGRTMAGAFDDCCQQGAARPVDYSYRKLEEKALKPDNFAGALTRLT